MHKLRLKWSRTGVRKAMRERKKLRPKKRLGVNTAIKLGFLRAKSGRKKEAPGLEGSLPRASRRRGGCDGGDRGEGPARGGGNVSQRGKGGKVSGGSTNERSGYRPRVIGQE